MWKPPEWLLVTPRTSWSVRRDASAAVPSKVLHAIKEGYALASQQLFTFM